MARNRRERQPNSDLVARLALLTEKGRAEVDHALGSTILRLQNDALEAQVIVTEAQKQITELEGLSHQAFDLAEDNRRIVRELEAARSHYLTD